MRDPRQKALARVLVEYSTRVRRGDIVLVKFTDGTPLEFVREIQAASLRRGAKYVRLDYANSDLALDFYRNASPSALGYFPAAELEFMKQVDVFIGLAAPLNSRVLAGVPGRALAARQRLLRPIQEERVNRTRWVVTRYPTQAQAQEAGMSLEDLEDFYFRCCNIDWERVKRRQAELVRILRRARQVRLLAPDTDLRFSLQGIGAISCHGERNMPDGEVFSAPVAGSVEGVIVFNTLCEAQGKQVLNPRLVFREGRVVETSAERGGKDLEVILDTDRGARVPGEFSFGLNPRIRRPLGNTLYDEKIMGSIHLALGSAYAECDNGNRSCLHWDLVRLMHDGEVKVDGKTLQRRGRFVPEVLRGLNRL